MGVANGYLYAMGGHDFPASNPSALRTDSVERYDPGTDTWTLVSVLFAYSADVFVILYFTLDRFAQHWSRCDRSGLARRMPDRCWRLRWKSLLENGGAVWSWVEWVDTAGAVELQPRRMLSDRGAQLPDSSRNGLVQYLKFLLDCVALLCASLFLTTQHPTTWSPRSPDCYCWYGFVLFGNAAFRFVRHKPILFRINCSSLSGFRQVYKENDSFRR